MDLFDRLFDTSDFPARWNCGNWSHAHGWLHVVSDLMVWSAYFAIPCILGWFILRRRDLPFRALFLLFGAFIVLCGTTHLMEAVIFWWPAYRLAGLIKLVTGVVSWITVAVLIRHVPHVLAMRSPEVLENEIEARRTAEAELRRVNEELEARVAQRTAELEAANALLRTEGEWFSTTLASVGDGVIATDREGRVTYLNPVAAQLTGWSREAATGLGLDEVFRTVDERTREQTPTPVARVLSTGETVRATNHTVLLARDGAETSIDESAAPILDAERRLQGAVLVFRDADERRSYERKLRHAEGRWRKLLGSGVLGVGVSAADGSWTEANDELLRILGHDRADLEAGRVSWRAATPREYIPLDEKAIAEARERGACKPYDKEYVRPDGERVPVSIAFTPIEERGDAFIVFVLDRSGLRRTQAELTRSRQKFAQLADAIPQLVWTAGPEGLVDWFNDRWYAYTGARPEDVLGRGWKGCIDPEIRETVRARWHQSLETSTPFDMVVPLRGADGRHRPFLMRMLPFRDEAGAIVRWFGTATDIGEQKRMQEELQAVAAKLSDADRRKDEFLATLAHELRNPLAPIRTGLEVMRVAADEPETVASVRATMERQTSQLVALVDDLLDVSRITRGKLRLKTRPVEIADVVATALESARPVIEQAGHRLEVELPDEPLVCEADPHRLAQVLANLLNNAAQYTPAGGHVALRVARHGDEVAMTVEDDGVGIPAAERERIFEMFAQVDQPGERVHAGLGIGLTLVRSLVELHRGRVTVASEGAHRGSAFTVTLPLIATTAAPDAPEPDEPEPGPPLRILVVDDNEDAALTLALVLERLGHEIRRAADGAQAVEAAERFRPDLILMDLGMPVMDGYEATRRIRAAAFGRGVMIVALTGWGQDEDRRRSAEAGFDRHLVKPVEAAALRRLLAAIPRRTP